MGEQLFDGLLAIEGLFMGGGIEEVLGQAALAGAGADGGEEAEEGVGAEDVEVSVVEVAVGCRRALRPVVRTGGAVPGLRLATWGRVSTL